MSRSGGAVGVAVGSGVAWLGESVSADRASGWVRPAIRRSGRRSAWAVGFGVAAPWRVGRGVGRRRGSASGVGLRGRLRGRLRRRLRRGGRDRRDRDGAGREAGLAVVLRGARRDDDRHGCRPGACRTSGTSTPLRQSPVAGPVIVLVDAADLRGHAVRARSLRVLVGDGDDDRGRGRAGPGRDGRRRTAWCARRRGDRGGEHAQQQHGHGRRPAAMTAPRAPYSDVPRRASSSLPARAKARCQVEDVCGGAGSGNGTGVRVQPAVQAGPREYPVRPATTIVDGPVWSGSAGGPTAAMTMTRNGHGGRRRRTAGLRHAVDPPIPTRPTHRPTGLGDPGGRLSGRLRPRPRLHGHRDAARRAAPAGRPGWNRPGRVRTARLGPRAGSRRRPARGRDEPSGPHRRVGPAADRRPVAGHARDGRRCPTTSWWRRLSCRDDGRPIPELVIGPFGVAIVHELEGRDRLRHVGDVVGDADPRRLGPDGASARSCRARRRARPPLADPWRPGLRGPRLRCPGHARRDDPAHHRCARSSARIRSRTGSRRSPASAASAPDAGATCSTRIRDGREPREAPRRGW